MQSQGKMKTMSVVKSYGRCVILLGKEFKRAQVMGQSVVYLEYKNKLIKSFSNTADISDAVPDIRELQSSQLCLRKCKYSFLSVEPWLCGPAVGLRMSLETSLFTVNGCIQNLLEGPVRPSNELCSFVFL